LRIQKVGMIVEGTIKDDTWNEKGYQGLLEIGEMFDVSVHYKENVKTKEETIAAVKDFAKDGVNLIFGHSNIYGQSFTELSSEFSNVHFVYFNGGYFEENVTSLNLNSQAMGFFAGMVASEMTGTKKVGIIAAYEWQPEIEGFFEGVKYQKADTKVHIDFVNDWNNDGDAQKVYEAMRNEDVDVFYPAGKPFSEEIIERASSDDIYTVGYLTDQSDHEEPTVLTSTIQHVHKLYVYAAEQFNKDSLEGGIMSFGFQDEIITLGEFSPNVPKSIQMKVERQVDKYIKTNLLPHEQ
jgi:transcriptional activator of comK gene